MEFSDRKIVDLLVNQFWKLGYLTISRRFGTYLPEPANVGNFKIDIVGRNKNRYAIGIALTKEDFQSKNILNKLEFLATRHTKYSSENVQLFVGVSGLYFQYAKEILKQLNEDIRKNIRLFQIVEPPASIKTFTPKSDQVLFS